MDKLELLNNLRKKGFPSMVVDSFGKVKREDFVPDKYAAYSYEDMALPLEDGSTLSQPYTVAFMLTLLELKQGQKILEIGSGSGYVLALISEIIKDGKIYGIEINRRLAVKSKKILSKDSNIEVVSRDGSEGLKEHGPFDRILISASAEETPEHLISQLKDRGIIVAAVRQSIIQIKKEGKNTAKKEFPGFVFVPLRKEEKP